MSLSAPLLISLIAFGTYLAFRLAPARRAGSPEMTNSLSGFLIALTLNITFPAALYYLFKDGVLVWARPFSGSGYVAEALVNVLLALVAFAIGYSGMNIGRLLGGRRLGESRDQFEQPVAYNAAPIAIQAMWVAIGLGILLKLFALLQFGIGPELITRLSGTVRREMILTGAESAGTTYLVLISTVAEAAAAILVARALKERQRLWAPVAILIGCLMLTYLLTGKRSVIILPAVLAICAVSTFYRPVTLRALPVLFIGMLAFGMGSLLLRILAPQSALGNVVDYRMLGEGSLFDFYLYSPEFAGFDMLVRAVAQGDRITEALGGGGVAFYRSFIEPFLYVIPRALWPDKPQAFVDLSHGFYVVTFGGGITDQTPGFAATLIGYATVLGGPALVVVSFLLLGWVAAAIDRVSPKTYGGLMLRALGMVLIFQIFRQGSIGWTFLTIVQTMTPAIIVWLGFVALSRGAGRPRRARPLLS